MSKLSVSKVKKFILMLVCVIIAGVLAGYSDLSFSKVIVMAMIGYIIICWKAKKLSALLVCGAAFLLCIYTGRYFKETLYPLREKNDATRNQLFAQVSIPGSWENHDMWISPMVEGKKVDLTYADEWCHDYFEEFAADVQVASEKKQEIDAIYMLDYLEYFAELNEHYFNGTRDFFEQELMDEMYDRDIVGHIFLALDGLAETDTVCVITDEYYNMYLMSTEVLEKVLDGNEG